MSRIYSVFEQIIGTFLKKTGGTMTGPLDMDNQPIRNIPDPKEDCDAVSKRYSHENFVAKNAVLKTVEEIEANTRDDTVVGALALNKYIKSNLYFVRKFTYDIGTVTIEAKGYDITRDDKIPVAIFGSMNNDPIYGCFVLRANPINASIMCNGTHRSFTVTRSDNKFTISGLGVYGTYVFVSDIKLS